MTITELSRYILKTGVIRDNGLSYGVRILNVRPHYGSLQFLVQPLAGFGERWVNETTFIFDEE